MQHDNMSERLILKQSIKTLGILRLRSRNILYRNLCFYKENYKDKILMQVEVTGKHARSLSSNGTISAKKTRETINAAQSADAYYLRKIPITLVDAIYNISCASQCTFLRGNCDRSDR